MMVEENLKAYGGETSGMESDKGSMLVQAITMYATDFNSALAGTLPPAADADPLEIFGGARINFVLHDIYQVKMMLVLLLLLLVLTSLLHPQRAIMRVDPLTGLNEAELRSTIRNISGLKTYIRIPAVNSLSNLCCSFLK